jgi:purine-binding chemotaxis protein CheW
MTSSLVGIDCSSVRTRLAANCPDAESEDRVDQSRLNETFRQRAVKLARRGAAPSTSGALTPVLTIRLGAERFGIELAKVVQVFSRVIVTPVPGAAAWLRGVASLRGQMRSVIDLGLLLGLTASKAGDGCVVLLRTDAAAVGAWVDETPDICRVDLESLAPIHDLPTGGIQGVVRRVAADGLQVIAFDALMVGLRSACRQHGREHAMSES